MAHVGYFDLGGLMAYATDLGEAGRHIASQVHQIFTGAEPGDIPIYRATKYELVINPESRKSIGLTMPQSILARADAVIE